MVLPRHAQIDFNKVTTLHLYHRTVRKAFLIGPRQDSSPVSDSHRKTWIVKRLRFLSQVFCVDIATYAILDNHYHLIARTRPDLSETLTPKQVAQRWWNLYPRKRDTLGNPETPSDFDLEQILFDPNTGDPNGLFLRYKNRLSSISWFMKELNEFIAKKANREDKCTGCFWDGRFKSEVLTDQAAVLACMAYIDLNPIRAGLAETPEDSHYTAVQAHLKVRMTKEKIRQLRSAYQEKKLISNLEQRMRTLEDELNVWNKKADWLIPIQKPPALPNSNSRGPILYLDESDYLKILDWTGRQMRKDKKGKIPGEFLPILERLEVKSAYWLETVTHFDHWFYRFIGTVRSLKETAKEKGFHWVAGIQNARIVFKTG